MSSSIRDKFGAERLIKKSRRQLSAAGFFSALINLLMLTGAFYMLQVYDRVLPSRSVQTLVALTILIVMLYGFQAVLDVVRGRIMARIGGQLVMELGADLFAKQFSATDAKRSRPLSDLEVVRGFATSNGANALFDLPWIPIYIFVIYLFHPVLGAFALICAVLLTGLALLAERLMRPNSAELEKSGKQIGLFLETAERNGDAINAMGMTRPLSQHWLRMTSGYVSQQIASTDISSGFSAITRALRMMAQSAILGLGAYLVIYGQASAGIIVAGSIIFGRAMAPIDVIVGQWRQMRRAYHAWQRLKRELELVSASKGEMLKLPRPFKNLTVEEISLKIGDKTILDEVAFELEAGDVLAVIGPSAAGKTSLARVLSGLWSPDIGSVSLDGAELAQFGDGLGQYIGYVPQQVELFAGTISQNIARFDPDANDDEILKAAHLAGVHELILSQENGYNTLLSDNGASLSAGQKQRLVLARALYADPFLLVLDEPNSNLDQEGESALSRAIESVSARGGIVVIITHRASTMSEVTKVLMLAEGGVKAFKNYTDIAKRTTGAGATKKGGRDA